MNGRTILLLGLAGLLALPLSLKAQPPSGTNKYHLYVGTYTGKKSKGIYLFEADLRTGELKDKGVAAEFANPTFLAIHPNQHYLYAVTEVGNFEGKKTGGVGAFKIDAKTGKLTFLNAEEAGGTGPCHVVTDKAGKFALVANYGGGSVASLPIQEDGKVAPAVSVIQHKGVSVDKSRQSSPHAHSINLDKANRFAMAADLGLDKILIYKFDSAKGTLTPNEPDAAKLAPGSGPRHFTFHPDGKHAFVINEMALTVTSFSYDADKGTLTEIETVPTVPKDLPSRKGMSTAEVVVHPSGKFVYGSNRGPYSSIAIFGFENGKLTPIGNPGENIKTPRNFMIEPTGNFLLVANQSGDSIVVFRIDPRTGHLTQAGPLYPCPSPVCLRMMPVKE